MEVLGEHAGWIALQAGIAARADAVLMPETPCRLRHLVAKLKDKLSARFNEITNLIVEASY